MFTRTNKLLVKKDIGNKIYLGNLLNIYYIFSIFRIWIDNLGASRNLSRKIIEQVRNTKPKYFIKPYKKVQYLKRLLLLHHLLIRNKIPLAGCS